MQWTGNRFLLPMLGVHARALAKRGEYDRSDASKQVFPVRDATQSRRRAR